MSSFVHIPIRAMRKSLALIAVLSCIVLLTAFSAEAAEGARAMGEGVTKMIKPDRLEQSKLLVTTSIVRKSELKDELAGPLGQKRKDTTSAGIQRSAGEPKQNTPNKALPEQTARVAQKDEPAGSKFGIYNTIKDSILDFFLPSRKKQAPKIDLSRVQKDGRTENARSSKSQPVR